MNHERRLPPGESTRLSIQLARIALVSTPRDEMRHAPQDNFRYFDIADGDPDGAIIGPLELQYFPMVGNVRIHNVKIDQEYRRQGLGVEMYRAIPFIPAPDGEFPPEHGWVLRSDASDSADGRRVWKSLAKRGFADRIARNKYAMRPDLSRPEIMTIQELD